MNVTVTLTAEDFVTVIETLQMESEIAYDSAEDTFPIDADAMQEHQTLKRIIGEMLKTKMVSE